MNIDVIMTIVVDENLGFLRGTPSLPQHGGATRGGEVEINEG
jgi:hypothetical protein